MQWTDQVGQWASVFCVVHCMLMPIVLSMSAVLAHFLPSDESTHRCLAIVIALIGAIALVSGYRIHRRKAILYLMLGGLACIACGAFFGDLLPNHWFEVGVTFIGSLLMISSHRLNHTFCADCVCSHGQ
jgi:uncharacterized membrane protein YfcA